MAKISLVRVDDKLIYGQIVNSHMNFSPVKKVLIIDDTVAKKPVLQDALRMVMPYTIELETISCEQLPQKLKENWLGPLIVLFKNIDSAVKAYREGFTFEKIEIGDTGRKEGVFTFGRTARLSKEDVLYLEELHENGVVIILHNSFSEGESLWSNVRKKPEVIRFISGYGTGGDEQSVLIEKARAQRPAERKGSVRIAMQDAPSIILAE